MENIFERIDEDGSGAIDMDEFVDVMRNQWRGMDIGAAVHSLPGGLASSLLASARDLLLLYGGLYGGLKGLSVRDWGTFLDQVQMIKDEIKKSEEDPNAGALWTKVRKAPSWPLVPPHSLHTFY